MQCGNASLSKWCILQQFCFVRLLFRTRLWALHSLINKLRLSFAPCLCVFSTVRCTICFVVASFALWFCHCGILLFILVKGMVLRYKGGISNWETTSWRGNCHNRSVSSWYRRHRAVQRRVSPKRGNKHGKWSGKSSLKWWLVWRMALCTQTPLSFWLLPVWNDKRENSFRWKIEGKSGENLWNTVLLSGVLILLDCVCLS